MFQSSFHTKIIIFTIFDQSKYIPSKALIAQCVHPLTCIQHNNVGLKDICPIIFVQSLGIVYDLHANILLPKMNRTTSFVFQALPNLLMLIPDLLFHGLIDCSSAYPLMSEDSFILVLTMNLLK